MTSKLKRAVRQALPVLALALLIVEVPRVAQADSSGFEQMQAVLAGRPGVASPPAAIERATAADTDAADAQQLARRSVVGTGSSRPQPSSLRLAPAAQAAVNEPHRGALLARGDAQALARRALLGPRAVPAAGS